MATSNGFATTLCIEQLGPPGERVVVYRKRVSHETRKNFQLDLFSADDGSLEYSAVATNKRLGVEALWHFMAGRGGHEKTLAELKTPRSPFEAIPTNDRLRQQPLWQQLGAARPPTSSAPSSSTPAPHAGPRTCKRTCACVLQSLANAPLRAAADSLVGWCGLGGDPSCASRWRSACSGASSGRWSASNGSPLDAFAALSPAAERLI